MAGVGEANDGGALGGLARSQYKALAAVRWSMFRNGLRSRQGAAELGARVVVYIVFSVLGLAVAFGLGAGAYFGTLSGKWVVLSVLLWAVFLLWQMLPVSLASFQEQFDINGLLRFPVGFAPFCVLHLIFGLVDASTIVGGLCCLGIGVGITMARPELWAWVALGLGVFSIFNILLVRAIFAWIDRWLAQRRTREIVSGIFLLLMLSLQLLNPAFHGKGYGYKSTESKIVAMPGFKTAIAVQRWLPPGLAAEVVEAPASGNAEEAVASLGVLGIFVLVAGGTLVVRLRAEYRGENLSDAPSRTQEKRERGKWLIDGSGPIAAVMEKEFRTFVRSLPLLYGVGAPLLMGFVLSGIFRKGGPAGGHSFSMGLMVSLAYVMVGFTQLFYNNLGPDGAGIQMLFLSPTPLRTVMLAKNMFHALLFALDAAIVLMLAPLRLGWPTPAALAVTVAWLLFALPVHLTVGNAMSLMMPYRMNLGRMGKQRGSQASALLSLVVQVAVLGLGLGMYALFSWLDRLWLAAPVFLVMAAVAGWVWMQRLRAVDGLRAERRESLIATLAKAD